MGPNTVKISRREISEGGQREAFVTLQRVRNASYSTQSVAGQAMSQIRYSLDLGRDQSPQEIY